MKNLKIYVEQKNFWNQLMKRPLMNAENLTPAQVRDLMDSIECDLSPENLTCDGELRGAKLLEKQRRLLGAKNDLETIYG